MIMVAFTLVFKEHTDYWVEYTFKICQQEYACTCLMVVVGVIVDFYGTVILFYIALYIAIFHLTLTLLEEQFVHI